MSFVVDDAWARAGREWMFHRQLRAIAIAHKWADEHGQPCWIVRYGSPPELYDYDVVARLDMIPANGEVWRRVDPSPKDSPA